MLVPQSGSAPKPRVASAASYPGIERLKRNATPSGLRGRPSKRSGHNRVAVGSSIITQGSSLRSQPWALGLNRFAVPDLLGNTRR
jgi:hypothetical protein